jgi:glutamyl-Q tRNA(Asp) synthetase
VANAVWTWGLARAAEGRVLLRIEDHDRGRCRPEYERGILDDLDWLGLVPDGETGGSLGGPGPSPWRQSDCAADYEGALAQLRDAGRVFACRCSRRTIARTAGAAGDGVEVRYPGTCRDLGLAPTAGRGLRVALPDRMVRFEDLRHGPLAQRPAAQCGDLLVRDPQGQWTYQFAVTVDDLRHGVTLVVRGDDLLDSTGRQLLLRELLGGGPGPAFLHHPLIFSDRPGVKLSKRHRAAGLGALRDAGWPAARVLGEAAFRTGLLDAPRPAPAAGLGALFGG